MRLKLLTIGLVLSGLVSAQNVNVKFRSQFKYPSGTTLANICGYVDKKGNEYALVGTSKATSIVDVTNPDSPKEVKSVTGPTSQWREIKVKGDYAYVTTEGGGGLQIINLASLPNASGIVDKSWTGGSAGKLTSIHSLHIDGNFVYLYGSNLFSGGPLVADISDPYNPVYVGNYQHAQGGQNIYVHDGYVRNDTLYACHIFKGFTDIVDFRDKKKPKVLGTVVTPGKFSHNSWLLENSKVMFTTDEVDNSFLTAYDISNPANINELDRIQSNPGSNSVVHNVHIIKVDGGEFAVTSWYKDGFTIVDATRPSNLIQVGNYDTYSGSGGGMSGAWGVFPYFPSGTIVVSNVNASEGLFVFTPTYVRASYLEGIVTDSITNVPINGATIQIVSAGVTEKSNVSGEYATGLVNPANTVYSIKYSATKYKPKTLTGVSLSSGKVTVKNVQLVPENYNGISENELDNVLIQAYPNPFTNEITISYEFSDKVIKGSVIELQDMLGRTVNKIEAGQLKGNVSLKSDLPSGVYFVRMINGTQSSAPLKIVKTVN